MKIKRYEGQYVHEVIAQIREEMGVDAVVLHTRWRNPAGLKRLLGKPQVEVWAGLRESEGEIAPSPAELVALPAAAPAPTAASGSRLDVVDDPAPVRPTPPPRPAAPAPAPPPTPAPAGVGLDDLEPLVAAVKALTNGHGPQPATNGQAPRPALNGAAPATPAPPAEEPAAIEDEPLAESDDLTVVLLHEFNEALSRIESKVDQLGRPAEPTPAEAEEPARLRALLQAGVDREVATEVLAASPNGSVSEALYDTFQCVPPVDWTTGGKVIALVGPSGVGKTTTVAKLAGWFGLGQGARTMLASTDVQRIGTFEQIRALGQLMDLPTAVLRTPAEAKGKLATARAQHDLVLVDTGACTPAAGPLWEHLLDTLIAVEPDEIHVVVAASLKTSEARRLIGFFREVLPVTGCIVTKLDECAEPGLLVDLAWRCLVPFSYLGVGHTIPGDLEVATPETLLQRVWASRSEATSGE